MCDNEQYNVPVDLGTESGVNPLMRRNDTRLAEKCVSNKTYKTGIRVTLAIGVSRGR